MFELGADHSFDKKIFGEVLITKLHTEIFVYLGKSSQDVKTHYAILGVQTHS